MKYRRVRRDDEYALPARFALAERLRRTFRATIDMTSHDVSRGQKIFPVLNGNDNCASGRLRFSSVIRLNDRCEGGKDSFRPEVPNRICVS